VRLGAAPRRRRGVGGGVLAKRNRALHARHRPPRASLRHEDRARALEAPNRSYAQQQNSDRRRGSRGGEVETGIVNGRVHAAALRTADRASYRSRVYYRTGEEKDLHRAAIPLCVRTTASGRDPLPSPSTTHDAVAEVNPSREKRRSRVKGARTKSASGEQRHQRAVLLHPA